MRIETIEISKINPAVYNPRKDLQPGDSEYEKLKKSLTEFDLVEPLIWNERTGNLVGGHQRLKILAGRGDTEVEVSVVDLPDEKEKALNLALNKISGEWDFPRLKDLLQELDTGDFDIEITGFDESEIENLMTQFHVAEKGLTDDDAIPEQVETICKTGDLWQLDEHRLLCGDATKKQDVERLMGGEKAGVVFTDPPYGIDYSGGRTQVVRHKPYGRIQGDKNSDISHFIEAVLGLTARDVWVCCSPVNLAPALKPFDTVGGVNAVVVWDKGNIGLGYQWVRRRCEFILFWTSRNKAKGADSEQDLWEIPADDKKQLQHGAQKPVALIERTLRFSGGNSVADLFGGSGSTLIACEKLNRRCFMMEIDEHYNDVIIQRWQNFTGQEAVKLNGN